MTNGERKDGADGEQQPAAEQPAGSAGEAEQPAAEKPAGQPAEAEQSAAEKPEDSAGKAKQPAAEKPAGSAPEPQKPKPERPAKKAERPKVLPGGAAPVRPGLPERAAEADAPDRERPPPGGIADLLSQALPGVKMEAYQGLSHVIVEVGRDDIVKVMQTAKDELDCKFLLCLFGVDHEDDGMDVVYQLVSYDKGHEVTVKTRLAKDDLRVASVSGVWKGANWHERETRDMFGIEFDGHPHLVPLLLPEDMTDHYPLRKDNPLAEIEEWQGDLLGGNGGEGDEEGEE